MFSRRQVLALGAAFGASAPTALLAHAPSDYVLPPEFMPREVELDQAFPAGELHVYPEQFALYLTHGGKAARRYAVGVGQAHLYHDGEFVVGDKQEWPRWIPTQEMIRRNPEQYAQYADGVPGGPGNPVGARALYLYQNDRDTYLRIHGTSQPWTIGQAVSNGCARLVNDQIVELYEMVEVGARVVLHPRAT